MSTITQTICQCGICGANGPAGGNAHWARELAQDAGWQQLTKRAWNPRTRRPEQVHEDVCPECLARLTGSTVERVLREAGVE